MIAYYFLVKMNQNDTKFNIIQAIHIKEDNQ